MPRTSPLITAVAEFTPATPVDLVALLRVIWAGKWLIMLLTTLAVGLAGYYGFALASPRYAATAVIDSAPPSGGVPDDSTDSARPANLVAALQTSALLQQVIDQLDLQDDPAFNRYLTPVAPLSLTGIRTRLRTVLQGHADPAPDADAIASKLVQNLRDAVQIDHPRDSNLLQITVSTHDPHKAALIANTLAQAYLSGQTAAQHQTTETAMAWLAQRARDLQQQQTRIEQAIATLVSQGGLQDPTSYDQIARQLREVEALRITAAAGLARSTDTTNRARLASQIASLDASRDHLSAETARLGQAQTALDNLQYELAANRLAQADHQTQLQSLILRAGQTGQTARILNGATQARYLGPQRILLLQIAALVGVLGGVMLVVLRHHLRRGFIDATALQSTTKLPVLAQMPLLASRRPARLLGLLDASTPSAASESFRHLRTSLILHNDPPPQVILSTSAIPGEGKTTQAIGLAHSFAALGKRVLLVDADLRQGAFGRYFALTGTDGLAAVVLGHVALAQATETSTIPGVDLLAGGAQDGAAAELLFLPALTDVMAQARAAYDIVIIDAPPVLPLPDALALARHADATVFAVRWDRTPPAVVLTAIDRLAAAHLPVTGLTLTQVHTGKQAQRGGISFARYGRGYFHA